MLIRFSVRFQFVVFLSAIMACFSLVGATSTKAQEHTHEHHDMTPEQFAELREKVPLYREFSDEQIIQSMVGMGPAVQEYLSEPTLSGDIGVLPLGHGFGPSGNELFRTAHEPTAAKHPTAMALGMAMMSSSYIQTAVDDLTAAGADTILVIPVTTLKTGKLIGQWRYIFGEQDEAPWMSVPRTESGARIVFGPTPSDDPLISKILLSFAIQRSRDPANEVVALIGHGATNAEANALELIILEQHAAVIRDGGAFVAVRGFTLQDDAPSAIRNANIAGIRGWMQAALDRNERIIVVTTLPVRGNVHDKIRSDLAGLEYDMNEQGVVEHPLYGAWIESVIASIE
jgi:hypothetical protein